MHRRNIMVYSMDVPFRPGLVCFFLFSALIMLVIPQICIASTPPIEPSLLFTVSNNSGDQDAKFSLQFTWNGFASYNVPPEDIVVEVISMKEGGTLGTFTVPRQSDACTAENTCTYRASVDMGILPPGEFMLVAYDPLSGASARQVVAISSHAEGSEKFFNRSEGETAFFVVSGLFVLFLVIVLAMLVSNRKG